MKRYLTTAAVAAATLLFAASAGAAVRTTASAALTNVQFSVTDLTPDDGIAAGFQFGPRDTTVKASLTMGQFSDGLWSTPYFPVPVNAQARFFDYNAQATTSGALGSLSSAIDVGAMRWQGDNAQAEATQRVSVLLKAHSAFTVSGRAEAALWTADPDYPVLPGYAGAGATLLYTSVDKPWLSAGGNVQLAAGQSQANYDEWFSLTATNDFDYDIELTLSLSASTVVNYDVSAVPEPGTWAMLGAGLLVLAGRRRFGRSAA
jgi:hypothetical protein